MVRHEHLENSRHRRSRQQPRCLRCGRPDFEGLSYSTAVAADLERDTGVKPEVGFNWYNGNLQSVTVTFPKVYVGKPLDELAGTVREVVAKEFKQKPDTIVLGFALAM